MSGCWSGLRVEVEVPGDERISTLAVFKDLEGCLALPAAAVCRLIVVIGVICVVGLEGFHLVSVARTPDTLVLDVESCNQLAGLPWLWGDLLKVTGVWWWR